VRDPGSNPGQGNLMV